MIAFLKPLTVIVGQNGCGKTTIIESLLFACTGVMPPGCDKGKTFVHDPKMTSENCVKAKVRLRFSDRSGKDMVVLRSVQVTQKKTTASFQALDGVIITRDDHGNKVSTTNKCTDMDKMVPELFGVSKAILESVIFCHQEASNWPLSEGKVLKDKFDAIFESTRYSMALKAIRDAMRAKTTEGAQLKGDKDVLNERFKQAKVLRKELREKEEKLEGFDRQASEAGDSKASLGQKLAQINKDLQTVEAGSMDVMMLQSVADQKRVTLKVLYDQIDTVFEGTDAELSKTCQSFDRNVKDAQQRIADMERAQSKRGDQSEQLLRHRNELASRRGGLEVERRRQEESRVDHSRLVGELRASPAFGGRLARFKFPLADADGPRVQTELDEVQAEARDTLKNCRAKNKKEEDGLTAEISKKGADLAHAEAQVASKKKDGDRAGADLAAKEAELKGLRREGKASDRDITNFKAALAEARAAEEAERGRSPMAGIKLASDALEKQRRDCQYDMDTNKKRIDLLKVQDGEEREIAAKKVELASREQELSERLKRLAPSFQKVIGRAGAIGSLNDDLGTVEDKEAAAKEGVDRHRRELTAAQERRSKKSAQVELLTGQLRDKERHVKEQEASTGDVVAIIDQYAPGAAPLLERLAATKEHLDAKVTKAKETIFQVVNAAKFLDHYLQMGMGEHCCPLCKRDMEGAAEKLFDDTVKQKIQDTDLNSDKNMKRKEKLRVLEANAKVVAEQGEGLRALDRAERELAAMRAELDELQRGGGELEQLGEACARLEAQREAAAAEHDEAHKLIVETRSLQSTQTELEALRRKIASLEAKLRSQQAGSGAFGGGGGGGGGDDGEEEVMTLAAAEAAREALMESMQTIQNDIGKRQAEQSSAAQKMSLLQSRVADAQNELRGAEEKMQAVRALEAEMGTLRADMQRLREEVDEIEVQLVPLANQHAEKERDRKRKRERWAAEEAKHERALKDVEAQTERYRSLQAAVAAIARNDKAAALTELAAEIDGVEAQHKKKHAESSREEEKLRKEKSDFDQQETQKRRLKDNVNYREAQADLKMQDDKIEQARAKMEECGIDAGELQKQRESITRKLGRGQMDMAKIEGLRTATLDSKREVEAKLKSRDFTGIDEACRKAIIKYETTIMAVADLDNYHKALDKVRSRSRCLLRFSCLFFEQVYVRCYKYMSAAD